MCVRESLCHGFCLLNYRKWQWVVLFKQNISDVSYYIVAVIDSIYLYQWFKHPYCLLSVLQGVFTPPPSAGLSKILPLDVSLKYYRITKCRCYLFIACSLKCIRISRNKESGTLFYIMNKILHELSYENNIWHPPPPAKWSLNFLIRRIDTKYEYILFIIAGYST